MLPIIYAAALLANAVSAPIVLHRRGWPLMAGILASESLAAGVAVAAWGALYRKQMGYAATDWSAAVLAAIAFAALSLPPALAVGVTRLLDTTLRLQVVVALIFGLVVAIVGYPFFGLAIGCIVTGDRP